MSATLSHGQTLKVWPQSKEQQGHVADEQLMGLAFAMLDFSLRGDASSKQSRFRSKSHRVKRRCSPPQEAGFAGVVVACSNSLMKVLAGRCKMAERHIRKELRQQLLCIRQHLAMQARLMCGHVINKPMIKPDSSIVARDDGESVGLQLWQVSGKRGIRCVETTLTLPDEVSRPAMHLNQDRCGLAGR